MRIDSTNTENMWDELLSNENYLTDYGPIEKDRINHAVKWIKISGGVRILNIGSGQGFLEKRLISEISDGSIEWTSLDISMEGLLKIKKINKLINTVHASILNLPFESDVFDVIVCMEVIEHIDKNRVSTAYKQLRKILKNSGCLIVSVPVFEPRSLVDHPVGHVRKFTPSLFDKELRKNGFNIIQSRNIYSFNQFRLLKTFLVNLINNRRPSVSMKLCRKA